MDSSRSGIDLTTGKAIARDESIINKKDYPDQKNGNVLWDTYHGVYLSYQPSGYFSNLNSYLTSQGYSIVANNTGILNQDISVYDAIVICLGSAWYSAYSSAEATALQNFVNNGGGLVVLSDNEDCPNANLVNIAGYLGLTLGLTDLNGTVTGFSSHEIFTGINAITVVYGGRIIASSPSEEQAWMNVNQAIIATALLGNGKVVTIGDMNLWENAYLYTTNNQIFSKNVFDWVAGIVPTQTPIPTDTPTPTPTDTPTPTPTDTPTPTPTDTPTTGPSATPTEIPPIPSTSPAGLWIMIFILSSILAGIGLKRSA